MNHWVRIGRLQMNSWIIGAVWASALTWGGGLALAGAEHEHGEGHHGGAAQQIAKFALANVRAFLDGSNIEGKIDLIDFPIIGDPSFWSSRMSPRQD